MRNVPFANFYYRYREFVNSHGWFDNKSTGRQFEIFSSAPLGIARLNLDSNTERYKERKESGKQVGVEDDGEEEAEEEDGEEDGGNRSKKCKHVYSRGVSIGFTARSVVSNVSCVGATTSSDNTTEALANISEVDSSYTIANELDESDGNNSSSVIVLSHGDDNKDTDASQSLLTGYNEDVLVIPGQPHQRPTQPTTPPTRRPSLHRATRLPLLSFSGRRRPMMRARGVQFVDDSADEVDQESDDESLPDLAQTPPNRTFNRAAALPPNIRTSHYISMFNRNNTTEDPLLSKLNEPY